jgi:hypothetical protein
MMAGPAIAALICAIFFEKARRIAALGLHFRLNNWWLYAWLIPLTIAVASVVFTLMFSGKHYVDLGSTVRAMAEAQGQDLSTTPAFLLDTSFIIAASASLGAFINAPILTFTEELGWRGYLHHLWRPSGFWRASLATGFVWGVWHMPAIWFYGLNYPNNPLLGMGLFIVFCMLLAPIMTLVRDRAGSVWATGLFHGAINAVGGITIGVLSSPDFPWNGIVGIGGFMALAVGVVIVALLQARGAPSAQAAAT